MDTSLKPEDDQSTYIFKVYVTLVALLTFTILQVYYFNAPQNNIG